MDDLLSRYKGLPSDQGASNVNCDDRDGFPVFDVGNPVGQAEPANGVFMDHGYGGSHFKHRNVDEASD